MNRIISSLICLILITLLAWSSSCIAQEPKQIHINKQVWASTYKSQGTGHSCFIFSMTSLLESEMYRLYGVYLLIPKSQKCHTFKDR